jgi:hypothetical protein
MGCGLICVVYKTGYHLLHGRKGLQGHPESTLNRVKDKIERQNSHVGIYREQNAVMNHAPRARVDSLQ